MVSEFVLAIGEMTIYHIDRVGYIQFVVLIPGKQPLHIFLEAPVRASEPSVGNVASTGFRIGGTLVQKAFPT